MSAAVRLGSSFRDPSGFVFTRSGQVYREVCAGYAPDYERLMSSGLYKVLVSQGWLVPHEELDLRLAYSASAYKVLRPEQLAFISHPYEWAFSQLKDAALLTLRIQRAALEHGLSLKDASAYNVQLHKSQMALIDTLSFEAYVPDRPWVAYRQFCQHFLAPLALMSRTDVRLGQLSRIHLDGVPLDLAARLLPWRTRWSLGLGVHLHAHAWMQRKYSDPTKVTKSTRGISLTGLQSVITHLERTVEGLCLRSLRTEWDDYYTANNNYGGDGLDAKSQLVQNFLSPITGKTVWDLGANDGRFSRVALTSGARAVIAWDVDPNCVEANYRQVIERSETNLFPLVLDLTNPSPATGWAHRERSSLVERGPADTVLALGLIHHLAISNNLPLSQIAAFLKSVARRLIIEWVPKEDSQVRKLLASRNDCFPAYEQSAFEADFQRYFQILRRERVEGTCRVLYLMDELPG